MLECNLETSFTACEGNVILGALEHLWVHISIRFSSHPFTPQPRSILLIRPQSYPDHSCLFLAVETLDVINKTIFNFKKLFILNLFG